MLPFLWPHLHSGYRRGQVTQLGGFVADESTPWLSADNEASLTDAYVTGFWEGDGSCYASFTTTGRGDKVYQTQQFVFHFFQKDPEILEKVQSYLGHGTLYQRNTQNQIWCLSVPDGPVRAKLLRRLRPHFMLLRSFEKIAKWRHRIDMLAGGFNPPYPDCSPDFLLTFQKVVDESLRVPGLERIEVLAPLMFKTKAETAMLSKDLPGCWEAMAYSHTSYDGKYPPTGKNHANLLRADGFEKAGLPDPLVLRAVSEGLMELPATSNYDEVRNVQTD
jgi:hypothetical protein